MKIKMNFSEEEIEVFGTYWEDYRTYFLVHVKGYTGLKKYSKEEINIVTDKKVGKDFIFYKNGVYYKPLIEEKLLEGLLNGYEYSYKRFRELLEIREREELNRKRVRSLKLKNTQNIILPYEYISNLINLTWFDVLYGIREKYLDSKAIFEHAYNIIEKEEEPSQTVLDLASLMNGESSRPYIEKLLSEEREQDIENTQNKFLYAVLNWIFEHKELYSDPLEVVETIYSDFDYPDMITNFIRYVPKNDPNFILGETSIRTIYKIGKII